jgi:hypothetical protein
MQGVRERLRRHDFSFDASIELTMHESLDQVSAVYGEPFPIGSRAAKDGAFDRKNQVTFKLT